MNARRIHESQNCYSCGMVVHQTEYHPHAACLMFKACSDGDEVRRNLESVVAFGVEMAQKLSRSSGEL